MSASRHGEARPNRLAALWRELLGPREGLLRFHPESARGQKARLDHPESRLSRRNLDELRLWELILNGHYGPIAPSPFVFMANTNLDPERGEGYRDAMADFLARRDLVDPLPGQITANWERPGPMRVSYLLPSADLPIRAARVWPGLPDQPHRLITVDITLPDIALP